MSGRSLLAQTHHLLRPTKRKVLLGLVAALLSVGLYWWFDGGRYQFIPRRFAAIDEGAIYRSAQLHRRLLEDVLREHEIQVIVDMAPDRPDDENARVEREVAKRLGIEKINLLTLDGSGRGDPQDYVTALQAVLDARAAKRPILVHCAAGTERTGALTALYRVLFQGWTGKAAYEEYVSYRRRPDRGRMTSFINAEMGTIVQALVASGALNAAPDPLPRISR